MKISPDQQWMVTQISESDSGEPYMHAFPLPAGPSRRICKRCWLRWSADNGSVLLRFRALYGDTGRTVVIPLKNGEMLPPTPANGFQNTAEAAMVPGAFVIPYENVDVMPGTQTYAFVRGTQQWNIFQIPLR